MSSFPPVVIFFLFLRCGIHPKNCESSCLWLVCPLAYMPVCIYAVIINDIFIYHADVGNWEGSGEKESESGRQHLYQRHSSHCLAEFYLPWLILFLICGRSKCCSHELNYENNMLDFNPHSLTYLQCPMSNVNLPVLKFITSWILNLVKLKS